MIRISTLIALITLLTFTTANSQRTYVDRGTSSSYTLYTGDSLVIQTGTFTGSISNWQQGAKISVAEGAVFNPSSFGYFLGRVYINGSAKLPSLDGQTANFRIYNYGKLEITGTTYLGGNARMENAYGAKIIFNGSVNINNSTLINTGTINAKSTWYIGNSSTLTNNNTINVDGTLEVNGSTATNAGKFYTANKLTLSGGTFTNNCRTIADRGIAISNTTVNNNGLFWASNAQNTSTITNGGTIVNTWNGKMKSVNFVNDGTISGSGYFYFTGATKSGGTIGRTGSTTDSIFIFDATRTSSSRIFDEQSGTIRNNVKFRSFTAPDTTGVYSACGLSYSTMLITLPVKWNYFFVNVSDNIPAISWSADQDPGTSFEVERSYNGIDFTSVYTINAATNTSKYQFDDKAVNNQVSVVYYRIKATEPTGAVKVTDTKIVRFANKKGLTVQTSPNPFTSQFTINYQSATRAQVTIRISNMTGQQQLVRNVTMNNGYNSISITEAATLAKGVYMVQLISENTILASEKIVKQ